MPISSDEPVYRRSRSERIRTLLSSSLKMPCFGEKLSLGKAARLPRKTKGMKHMNAPPVVASRTVGKLQLDKDSSSSSTTKPKGIAKPFYFRPAEECPSEVKKLRRFEEDEDSPVIAICDLSAQIEAMNNKVDMDEIFFGGHEALKTESNKLASAAISYLQDQGHKLELVSTGAYEGQMFGWGMRFHHNFKAKRADDPHAPVEMYFAQFRDSGGLFVECCVSLGEPDSLPYERDNRGCVYCTQFVHHPLGDCDGKIIGGQLYRVHG